MHQSSGRGRKTREIGDDLSWAGGHRGSAEKQDAIDTVFM